MTTIIQQMAKDLRVPETTILGLCLSASHRYKEFTIPKRSGGMRTIFHPARKLKVLQRWLGARVIEQMPIHHSAYAYIRGRGIGQCVERHSSSRYFLKLDCQDFFPSIALMEVVSLIERANRYIAMDVDEDEASLLGLLLTREGKLPIGSPASPSITNVFMYRFDKEMARYCEGRGLVYSRYADDITISSAQAGMLNDMIARTSRNLYLYTNGRLHINEDKTRHMSFAGRVRILGLNITPDGRISVGRELKRQVRSFVYRAHGGSLSDEERARWGGYLNFIASVEPQFIAYLESAYGAAAVNALRRT